MKPYENLSGSSGVVAYETGDESITVEFEGGGTYLYTYGSTGRSNVERMKALAAAGRGLSTFIAQEIRSAYAAKLR